MSAPECPYFNDCSAPLCPLDEASLSACAWFPDEETCHRRDLRADWIARARKIARVVANDSERGCFTQEMLGRNFRITAGLRGLDPDKGPISPERVKAWLAGHPALRERTEAERRELASKLRATVQKKGARSRARNQNEAGETERETGTEPSAMKVHGEALG